MTPRRTLGVVGTLVWDRIVGRDGESAPVEEWGGIAYALAGLAAVLPSSWSIRPILKIGADMAAEGRRFIGELPSLDLSSVIEVPESNNRVEIHYESASRRCERLTGGVPPWAWSEIAPLVADCDALYVNFISGFEMGLETARAVRDGFSGPSYADLHSLFLGKNGDGRRVPRSLESWATWLRCFDAVQMNEDEFKLLGGRDDPWTRARGALGPDLGLVTVTLGAGGASFVALSEMPSDPMTWRGRARPSASGRSRGGTVTLTGPPLVGDPTGCGDVWGAAMFGCLLRGDAVEDAMREANRLAGHKVAHRGARGLHDHLKGAS